MSLGLTRGGYRSNSNFELLQLSFELDYENSSECVPLRTRSSRASFRRLMSYLPECVRRCQSFRNSRVKS
jgi:hypothetical protein